MLYFLAASIRSFSVFGYGPGLKSLIKPPKASFVLDICLAGNSPDVLLFLQNNKEALWLANRTAGFMAKTILD
jgi:hypothetical protein